MPTKRTGERAMTREEAANALAKAASLMLSVNNETEENISDFERATLASLIQQVDRLALELMMREEVK
jgi:hypothetical protein